MNIFFNFLTVQIFLAVFNNLRSRVAKILDLESKGTGFTTPRSYIKQERSATCYYGYLITVALLMK